jgi:Eukaryotic aspartyl protease
MGMENASTSFWSQMYQAGAISSKSFSLCFSRPQAVDVEAGALTLGGSDRRLHQSDMVFAPLQKQGNAFYTVILRKMYLRSGHPRTANATDYQYRLLKVKELALNRGQVIVDSGTTDTYFSRAIQTEFKRAWKELTGKDYTQKGQTMTQEEILAMPSVVLQIAGDEGRNGALRRSAATPVSGLAELIDPDHPHDMIWIIPPTHFFEYDEAKQEYSAGVYINLESGSVLGGNAIMGHDVYFDIGNGVIGIAESDCNYTGLVQSQYNVTLVDPVVDSEASQDFGDVNSASSSGDFGDEGQGEAIEAEKIPEICASFSCRMGVVVGVASLVAALLIVRRSSMSSQIEYTLPGELELQYPELTDSDPDGRYVDSLGRDESLENSFDLDEVPTRTVT